MEKLELYGRIQPDGVLKLPLRDKLIAWCNGKVDRDVKLTIELRRKSRSNKQNAYYWGVVVPLVQEGIHDLGHELSMEEVHEFLKKEFNLIEVELENGTFIKVPGSTTELNTVQFIAYIERIQQFAAEMLQLYIPGPNEQTSFDFKDC